MTVEGRLRLAMGLRAAGITDLATLRAMELVPREAFLPPSQQHLAYENRTLPLPHGQTLSAPDVVARMTQLLALQPGERVLEIGTGSGYQAAVLAQLAARVYTIERWGSLLQLAVDRFAALGLRNIEAAHGDGALGWPSRAPFDAIIMTCGAAVLPDALVTQLSPGGRLLLPLAEAGDYRLQRLTRCDGPGEAGPVIRQEAFERVPFVPLLRGLG